MKKVLVEGKEFFGRDPTIATRNLPADAVQRVQVYDKQSDMAEFTGIPDGEEERTINLQLEDDAKRGYFGRTRGGLGADVGTYRADGGLSVVDRPFSDWRVRYDGAFTLNRFTPTTQLACVASVNNVNRAGFSTGDYLSVVGGAPGPVRSVAPGGRNDGFTETYSLGLNASRDFGTKNWIRGSYFLSSVQNMGSRAAHRHQLLGSDVTSVVNESSCRAGDNFSHRLNLNAQRTFAEGHDLRLRANLTSGSSSLSNVGFQETRTAAGQAVNTAATTYGARGSDLAGNAQLTWRKRLSESDRSIVALVRANISDPDQSGDLASTIALYDSTGVLRVDSILQRQVSTGQTVVHALRLSLSEPLGRGHKLEPFGERRATHGDQAKSVYDRTSGTPVVDPRLSSGFERTYTDVNVRVGNLDLRPAYSHRLSAQYRFFDQFSFRNLFAHATLTYTAKPHRVSSRFVNERAQQVITRVNAGTRWTARSPIRPIGAKLDLAYRLTYSTTTELVNRVENVGRVFGNTVSVGVENRSKDVVDVRAGGSVTLNNVTYSFNERPNERYVTGNVSANGTYYLGAWSFNTRLTYRLYDRRLFVRQNLAQLGASISRDVLNERGQIRLVGTDLLNRNQGVNVTNRNSLRAGAFHRLLGRSWPPPGDGGGPGAATPLCAPESLIEFRPKPVIANGMLQRVPIVYPMRQPKPGGWPDLVAGPRRSQSPCPPSPAGRGGQGVRTKGGGPG